jgi:hypothetical protein
MLEILESIKNLKIKNAALLEKQFTNNFKVDALDMNDYIKWFENQEK